jgi:putative membrane protein
VLLFVSEAERYVEILADAGIAQKVPRETWEAAVTALTREIKAGRPADGFVAAIGLCAKVLAEHFPPGAINRDELPNAIVEL